MSDRGHRSESVTPVFIIGMGHSGTTILYRMLALHPDAAWVSQYTQYVRSTSRPLQAAAYAIDRTLRRFARHDWRKNPKEPAWQRFLPHPVEALPLWKATMDGRGGESAQAIREVITEHAHASGKTHIILKPSGPYNVPALAMFRAAFPNAPFVLIIRDGRAAALSFRKKTLPWDSDPKAILRWAAHRWVEFIDTVEKEADLRLHVVRYESLCDDIHEQVELVLRHGGLDLSRFPYHRLPRTLTPTNELRLKEAAEGDLQVVQEIVGPYLGKYGYAPGS